METVKLSVKTVIGTGDPFDQVMLIPLISDWGVPKECIGSLLGEPCTKPLTRLYVLDEPLQGFGGSDEGFKVVGACRAHHELLAIHKGDDDGDNHQRRAESDS